MKTFKRYIKLGKRKVGYGYPTYIIAEMSANHNQDFERAVRIIEAAKSAGADAIKLQTYTPDTMTVKSSRGCFNIKGTPWDGKSLYELYGEAYTPWEWHGPLKEIATKMDLDFFSTPFDGTAVDFLEGMDVPAYKVASFEIVDIPLLRRIGQTRKPVILSTGMATLSEIDEAVQALRGSGNEALALLKCVSAYPASPENMNLNTIAHMAETFDVLAGLSDHSMAEAIPVCAVALGACIIEKHLTLSREITGPDTGFSIEPEEFRKMVQSVRTVELAMGSVHYGPSEKEESMRTYRRSLFAIRNVKAGEVFTRENVRSIRPACGLHSRYLEDVVGQVARRDIEPGTPLSWDLIGGLGR